MLFKEPYALLFHNSFSGYTEGQGKSEGPGNSCFSNGGLRCSPWLFKVGTRKRKWRYICQEIIESDVLFRCCLVFRVGQYYSYVKNRPFASRLLKAGKDAVRWNEILHTGYFSKMKYTVF